MFQAGGTVVPRRAAPPPGAVSPPSHGDPVARGAPGWTPHRQRPRGRHGGATRPRAGKKARRPTGPRETGTAGHPRYL